MRVHIKRHAENDKLRQLTQSAEKDACHAKKTGDTRGLLLRRRPVRNHCKKMHTLNGMNFSAMDIPENELRFTIDQRKREH